MTPEASLFPQTLSFDHPPRAAFIPRPEDKLLFLWGPFYSHQKRKQMHDIVFWETVHFSAPRLQGSAGHFPPEPRLHLPAGLSSPGPPWAVSCPGVIHRNRRQHLPGPTCRERIECRFLNRRETSRNLEDTALERVMIAHLFIPERKRRWSNVKCHRVAASMSPQSAALTMDAEKVCSLTQTHICFMSKGTWPWD